MVLHFARSIVQSRIIPFLKLIGDHFRVGDHFGVRIILGAVQYSVEENCVQSKSNACWFLFVQTLLLTINKLKRGGPQN